MNKFAGIELTQVQKLAQYGHTDKFMAEFFGVHPGTWAEWKKKNVEFAAALANWKNDADFAVEKALFERAKGMTLVDTRHFQNKKTGEPYAVEDIKHYPPDVSAIIFWLKNRKPEEWRDKTENSTQIGIGVNVQVSVQQQDLDERIRQITFGEKLEEALR